MYVILKVESLNEGALLQVSNTEAKDPFDPATTLRKNLSGNIQQILEHSSGGRISYLLIPWL